MSKKLNLAMIKEEVKAFDKKEKLQLTDDTYVYIYPNFAPSRISKMIQELLTDQQRATESGLNFDVNMADWLMLNIIKYFCDLDIPTDIKKKIQAFSYIVDSQYYPKIIESFPQESIQKINEMLIKINENLEELGKYNEKTMNKVIDDVVNEKVDNDGIGE